jgi:hypothetical protein
VQESIILDGEKKEKFCKELNIRSNVPKILVHLNDNGAEYYHLDDDCFYKLDFEIAKKYI